MVSVIKVMAAVLGISAAFNLALLAERAKLKAELVASVQGCNASTLESALARSERVNGRLRSALAMALAEHEAMALRTQAATEAALQARLELEEAQRAVSDITEAVRNEPEDSCARSAVPGHLWLRVNPGTGSDRVPGD